MSPTDQLRQDARVATVSRLAILGGQMAMDRTRRMDAAWKADGSMVTQVDLAIQSRLCGEIVGAFPEDGVLAEEEGWDGRSPTDARFWWVLDPLDGTNNFGRGLPGFSISVGLLRDGAPFAGAVYDPVSGWLFAGSLGRGAWLNGRRLQVEPGPLSRRSLFVVRTPFEGFVPPFAEGWFRRYRLRRFGSTALHLCYVALGGLAFVYDHHALLWDVAGAAPVLSEAGGVLTRPDGSPVFPIRPAAYRGEPIAFLAGDSQGHRESLEQILHETVHETRH
jgi:myo-inositol-1(or 4)-monophosphatase